MPRKKPLILGADSPLDAALEAFKRGGITAYPTETFYGLCVDPFNKKAIEDLFSLKGRSEKNPVSVIVADKEMLGSVVEDIPTKAELLIKKFWPGPLTIIFKAHPSVPSELTANTGKIGVRVSGSPVSTRLSLALGSPITATSANPSGKKPPVTAKEVIDYFDGSIDVLIDGGRLPGKSGSTIVDITGEKAVIIREGEIPSSEVLKALR